MLRISNKFVSQHLPFSSLLKRNNPLNFRGFSQAQVEIPPNHQKNDVSIEFSSEKKERMQYMGQDFHVTSNKDTKTSDTNRQKLAAMYIAKNSNRFGLRGNDKNKLLKDNNWELLDAYIPWNNDLIKAESERCLRCVDAPCQQGCPVNIDIPNFIHCLSNDNWYGAAKIILSDNPLGAACGQLCDVNGLCKSVCVLENNSFTHNGIEIGQLQQNAVRRLQEQSPYIKQIRDPKLKNVTFTNDRICLIGYGPASISAATYLSRLGYKNIDIYEKEKADIFNECGGGGVTQSEIPSLRHSKHFSDWEIQQMFDLNPSINIKYNEKIELNNIDSLHNKFINELNYDVVFIGAGNQHIGGPQSILSKADNQKIFNSKEFLNDIVSDNKSNPKLNGNVLVFGIGDVGLDCAISAYRCGADQVSVGFRRSFADIKCSQTLFKDSIIGEKCDILPNIEPLSVNIDNKTGKVQVEVMRTIGDYDGDNIDDDHYNYNKLKNESYIIECDHLILALGSNLTPQETIISNQIIELNNTNTNEWLYGGGDFTNQTKSRGNPQSIVNSVNDGKLAAWNIHKYLRLNKGKEVELYPSELPLYYTEIDLVDVSMTMKSNDNELPSIKFINPFGLASSPPTTSYPMIERSFELGWGFAITKTFALDKHIPTNITPRIYNINHRADGGDQPYSFGNIELITEKTASYWVRGSIDIKKKHPNKILIASIMAGPDIDDWAELIRGCAEDGIFDGIELNLSCPHGMPDKGMGAAIGHDMILTEKVTRFCVAEAKKYGLPLFVKETIEANEIEFAKVMIECNAYGITAINTVPGINDSTLSGTPYPNVGNDNLTAPGGISGNLIRPFATKIIASINRFLLDNYPDKHINIFGCGGVNNAENALHLIRYGADTIQICSAIMHNDFNIIFDLETGLKSHLYLNGYNKLDNNQIRGSLVKNVQNVTDMSVEQVKVALVDEDLCINCGKCYMSCNDTGYQAIDWNTNNRIPTVVNDACTGCGLCQAVCPVNDCINMVARDSGDIHHIDRGTFKQDIIAKW